MKNCTKKLTDFVFSLSLIHTKETEKIKTNILIRMHRKKKIYSKETKFISFIYEFEWMKIAKRKKRSIRISFLYDISKVLS